MKKLKFRVMVNKQWIYSFTEKGTDRLGWFFCNFSGMNIKQVISTDSLGNDIYED